MTVAPFDHPHLSGLLGDADTATAFSAEAEIEAMLRFEGALARAQSTEGVIPKEAGEAIASALPAIRLDHAALRAATARDGVIVPELVRQLRAGLGEPLGRHLHFGATSQDVVDTGLALRLRGVLATLESRLDDLAAALETLEARFGAVTVNAHTRMQVAIAVPASRKIAAWRDPLLRHRERLGPVRASVCVLSYGGAAGTLDALGGKADAVSRRLAGFLDLAHAGRARHSERDGVVALAAWLAALCGSLGKMGQDVALAAQSELGEIRLAAGGGSSAMPHKINPVAAETLVALARFNATLISGMHQALVHENERSGAAWTLEWMLLPQMAVASAAALRTACALVPEIRFVGLEEG